MMAEEGYAFQYHSYLETEAKICSLMQQILGNLKENETELVDNLHFIDFMNTVPNVMKFPDSPAIEPSPLTDAVKEVFLSSYGATPFKTVLSLKNALDILFEYRLSRNLEVAAVFRLAGPPDYSTCSEETQESGQALYE